MAKCCSKHNNNIYQNIVACRFIENIEQTNYNNYVVYCTIPYDPDINSFIQTSSATYFYDILNSSYISHMSAFHKC